MLLGRVGRSATLPRRVLPLGPRRLNRTWDMSDTVHCFIGTDKRHHLSVLVHRTFIPSQQAINMGKAYVVLAGDCDATIRWESAKVLEIEILSGSSYRGTYDIAPTDLSQQVAIHFKM